MQTVKRFFFVLCLVSGMAWGGTLRNPAAFAEENVTRYADISKDESRQVVVAPGTTNVYNGHATVVRTKTGKMIAVWTIGHGGACGPSAESTDGGKTWTRIDDRFPDAWKKTRNCPAVFSLGERDGKERLMVFSCGDYDMDQQRSVAMAHCVSEDDGLTWKMLDPIPVTCVMPLTTLVVLKSGELLGLYNDRWPELQKRLTAERGKQTWWNRVFQIRSRDGGMTWSAPEKVAASETMNLCEPFVLGSDDGQELCCIMRDNGGSRSQLAFSRDEGRTWSAPEPSSAALTGHRHHGVRDSKGRWTIAFRDVDSESPYRNHFCCWRGTYDDIVKRNDREKIKLLHSRAGRDCGYAACVLLPGDEVMAFTYIKYRKGPEKHSIVGVRIPDQLP